MVYRKFETIEVDGEIIEISHDAPSYDSPEMSDEEKFNIAQILKSINDKK
ncbi:hypothetical protein [Streptococcus agalactiae]|nr:hypothetical protein [Streptococcus agalactiae]